MAWSVFTFREQWSQMKANSADAICCASAYPAHTQWRPKLGKHDHIGFKAALLDPLGKFWSGFTFREQWPQMKANGADAISCASAYPAHNQSVPKHDITRRMHTQRKNKQRKQD